MSGSGGSGRQGRGGRGGSSSSGRGGRGGRRNSNRKRGRGNPKRSDDERKNGTAEQASGSTAMKSMRDEDVLIAFMSFLKSGNPQAVLIHEDYQRHNDQQTFLYAARSFLETQQGDNTGTATAAAAAPEPAQPTPECKPEQQTQMVRIQDPAAALFGSPGGGNHPRPDPPGGTLQRKDAAPSPQRASYTTQQQQQSMQHQPMQQQQPDPSSINMRSVEQSLGAIWGGQQQPNHVVPTVPTGLTAIWGAAPTAPPGMTPPPQHATLPSSTTPFPPPQVTRSIQHPPPPTLLSPQQPLSIPSQQAQQSSNPSSPWSVHSGPSSPPPGMNLPPPVQQPPPSTLNADKNDKVVLAKADRPLTPPKTPAAHKKEAPPPRRLWTHFEEQPGRITVDGYSGQDPSLILPLGPRQELTAMWSLPLNFLRAKNPQAQSLDEALRGMTVGLFRRGCTENGTQASIISKSVTGDNNRSYKYWKDQTNNSVCGKVPFYSPRTPGRVIFRLYNEHDPLYTLAMGPSLHVRVLEKEFEGSLRFILSNFKGKKSNPTSLSSLTSLAVVLETQLRRPSESAARAAWGCIQEARKVVDACWQEYSKTSSKMAELEEVVEDLKKQVEEEEEDHGSQNDPEEKLDHDDEAANEDSETVATLKLKTKALLGGRASCERKWRDSQLAFASILKAVATNPTMPSLLRRDLISKMRIEFELWCPLAEEFAVLNHDSENGSPKVMWYEPLRNLPNSITSEDFLQYTQARGKMQLRTLGLEPNTLSLEDVLFPRKQNAPNQRSMDPGAVSVFNTMSTAMGKFYQDLYFNEDTIVRLRGLIRERTEKCVAECGAFPAGTRVLIFGSSANGFGSPKSDVDMCLQIPDGAEFKHEEDGAEAMAKLGEYLGTAGMKEVDDARLGARIPILMYKCPNPFATDSESEDSLVDCDLSMRNPLAVLNTSYLRAYAEITPVTRVLASIIKRWAKARDINNPARHTLSSYGYILMLLHFLTYHKRSGNGLVTSLEPPQGGDNNRNQNVNQSSPILPNLHWMDPRWPTYPKGTPYNELQALPQNLVNHPFTEEKKVNTYFCRPGSPNDKAVLQMLFPGQDLSLAILLASFFRYYAYEFDYKKHVVSLHSTARRGIVEREMKAELDGWRNYSAALTIEDPFETFYDVAHVLRGGYYHRIRREFAVAYSKIADAASGRAGSWNKGDLRGLTGEELLDWLCEPVTTERDQQLPP